MPIFEHVSHYPQPRDEVFAWHTRPGGFVRLTPPGMATVVEGPTDLINPGSEIVLKISHPLLGLVPRPVARVGATWKVRHVELDHGRLFVDEQVSGPFRRWRHEHHFADGPGGGTTITDRVHWELPPMPTGVDEVVASHELRRLFAFREHQLREDLALHARLRAEPTHVLVSGAGGLIGSQVCALLTTGGHTVTRLVRRAPRSADEARWAPERTTIDDAAVERADAVVHLAGENIGGRFTQAKKRRILDSRVDGTRTIAAAIARSGRRQVLAQASGIGAYGARRPGELLTEASALGTGFLADVVRAWEDAAHAADGRTVFLRTGIVLSEGGGALAPMLPLFLAGV
ncbi:MAG TPA: NAD-dependent epimerase/dehydratase family protein, partial [Propionibacteriaceae bacterium]|nr:NAD-dependent epimerase/dehydratase family protein [Propionibacteriaceae bacterium]